MAASEEELVANVLVKESPLKIKWYSEIKAEPMEWYEKPWLPVTGLAGLAGPPGVGKSTLFAYEIARLTTGTYDRPAIKVLYLTKEDDESVIKARLKVAGADVNRVGIIKVEVPEDEITYERDLNLRDDLNELSELLTNDPEIKAIYLDPATSFLGVNEDTCGYAELRKSLEMLSQFARTHGILIRLMKHTKKDQASSSKLPVMSLVYGSQAWTEVARVFPILWPVGEELKEKLDLEDEDETNRLLLRGKNNYAPIDLQAQAFHLHAESLVMDDQEFEDVTKMDHLGGRSITDEQVTTRSAETAKETETRTNGENKTDTWIREQLKTGPLTQKDLQRRAETANGISWSTVLKRRNKLVNVIPVPGSTTNEKQWALKDQIPLLQVVDGGGTTGTDWAATIG